MSQIATSTSPRADRRDLASGGERLERRLFVALAGGTLLLTSWVGGLLGLQPQVAEVPAAFGALVLVAPLAFGAFREIRAGRPSSDSLASLAVLAALANNLYLAAGFLAFFLWLSELVLSRTAWGAQRAIRDLVELTPDVARVVEGGAEREVSLEALRVGQVVRVRPGENLPVDGRVLRGQTSINQASLTGEAVPIEATIGTPVYAGTSNLTGQIDVEVTAVAGESTIGKVEKLIREAENARTQRQELIERLAGAYVPVVLMVAALVWFFTSKSASAEIRGQAAERAITVLVVTCPGALLIAYPTAMVAAFAAAARLGIMVKNTRTLESASTVDTVVLDKTGTLTEGKPRLTDVVPLGGTSEVELLSYAIAIEELSDHPLAAAVVRDGLERIPRGDTLKAENVEGLTGKGVKGVVNGQAVWIGKPGLFDGSNGPAMSEDTQQKASDLESSGRTVMVVRQGDVFLGLLGLMDTPRAAARDVVARLKSLGIERMIMLTGDNQSVGNAIAKDVGLTDAKGGLMPEDKVAAIKDLVKQHGKVAMLGDGVNDAPALANATVGIAMGAAGSDVALETADVALMADDLSHLPFAVGLSRKTSAIIKQNLWVSLGVVAVLIPSTLFGLQIGAAIIFHEGSTLIVVANALRLLAYRDRTAPVGETR